MAEKEPDKKVNTLRNEVKNQLNKTTTNQTDIEEPNEVPSPKKSSRKNFSEKSNTIKEPIAADSKNKDKKMMGKTKVAIQLSPSLIPLKRIKNYTSLLVHFCF